MSTRIYLVADVETNKHCLIRAGNQVQAIRHAAQTRFAAIVAAAEREACAKVCEAQKLKYEKRAEDPEEFRDINPEVARIAGMTCDFNAAAIRARGQA